jgi:uncharacterized membrane protein
MDSRGRASAFNYFVYPMPRNREVYMTKIAVFALLALGTFSVGSHVALAQDRASCTAKCGGRAGGESANSPAVVACFRKCMGTTGNSDTTKGKSSY